MTNGKTGACLPFPKSVVDDITTRVKQNRTMLQIDALLVFVCGADSGGGKTSARDTFMKYASVWLPQYRFFKAEEVFRAAADVDVRCVPSEEQALADAIIAQGSRAVILGINRYAGPLYEALATTGGSQGAIIARYGVGHDGVDKTVLRKNNIVLTNTPGVLDRSVVEHAVWLLGSMVRNVAASHAQFRAGEYLPRPGTEVFGKVLGIIGFGAIGRRVAAVAHFGLGMRVHAADCRTPAELEKEENKNFDTIKSEYGVDVYTTDVEEVLREADVISMHIPSTESTHHYINAERLGMMKPGAMFINTARGPIVDETALYDALSSGRLAAAALDVFENEPYKPVVPEKDLRTLENVVLTPHIGSNTYQCNTRMSNACLKNVGDFFADKLDALSRVDNE